MFSDALLGVHVVVHVEARRGLGHRVRVLGHHGFARPVNVLFEILERGDPDLVVAHDITGGGFKVLTPRWTIFDGKPQMREYTATDTAVVC